MIKILRDFIKLIPAQSSVKCDLTSQRQTNSGFISWENRSKKKKENKYVYICLFIIRSVSVFISFDRFVELLKCWRHTRYFFSSLSFINQGTLNFLLKKFSQFIILGPRFTLIYENIRTWRLKIVNKYLKNINFELESFGWTLLLQI